MQILKILTFGFLLTTVNMLAQSKFLTLTSPLKNENITAGSDFNITWSSINVRNIKIEYSIDGGSNWQIIVDSTRAIERQFLWTAPLIVSEDVKIKLSDLNDKQINSFSRSNIKIISPTELLKEKRINSFQKKTNGTSILNIMPLGNSITRGIVGSSNETGYRRKLYQLLKNANYIVDFNGSQVDGVPLDFDRDHEGHGGWSASQPSNKTKSLVDSVYKFLNQNTPNIVLLHIGTNDIGRLSAENATIFDVADEIEQILDTIDLFEQNNSMEIMVLLAKIIDPLDDPATLNVNEADTTIAFNLELENRINNRISIGDRLLIVDQESALNSANDLVDGVHPNDIGYEKMATTWYSSLTQLLPKITIQPVARGGLIGDTVVFEVMASSQTQMNYQWQKDGENISGATARTLTVNSISIGDTNSKYQCIVSNLYGEVKSNEANLYVTPDDSRVVGGQLVFYNFDEGTGNFINDVSENGTPLDLTINTPGSISWFPNGIEIKSSATISTSLPASKIYSSCLATNEITLEVWLSTNDESQTGPARIVTLSSDASNRNFSISQNGNEFIVQLRTTNTSNNGIPSISATIGSFSDSLLHLVYTRFNNGSAKLFINGIEVQSSTVSGEFTNWDSGYFFGLANEFTDSRNWLGKFYSFSIFDRALSKNEVNNNFLIGIPGVIELEPPSNLHAEIGIDQSINLQWNDNSETENGFIVEYSLHNSNSFIMKESLIANTTNYIDDNLLDGTSYFYRIIAYNDILQSNPSNIISKTLALNSPSNLTAEPNSLDQILLNWSDNSGAETNYIIEGKADHPDSNYKELGVVSENITSYLDVTPKFYSPYNYRVYGVSQDTVSDFSNIVSLSVVGVSNDKVTLPIEYKLHQNFPNPFNPSTTINYSIPPSPNAEYSHILVKIFNNLGKEVKVLVNNIQQPGNYKIFVNLSNLPSGIYFYQLKTHDFVETKKMLLLK